VDQVEYMNWLGVLAVAVGFLGYFLGLYWARKTARGPAFLTLFVALALAVPAIVYALYYARVLGEPLWLYRVRALPGSELLGSFAGLLAGWTQGRMVPHLRLSSLGKRFLVPVAFGFAVSLPYLKPLFRPLDPGTLREEWKGEACLQSTASTCGPAAAATIVRGLGGRLSERELAREAFTCRSGTENWYVARTLRRHGFQTDFLLSDPSKVPLPAMAGVRLRSLGNSGHFIALLERDGDRIVLADPMEGLSTNTLATLKDQYEFTGFFLLIRTTKSSH
jgi:hypothetical protein